MKNLILILIFSLSNVLVNAQEIEWISFEKAIELNKTTPKNILIDVYTDWCGYCKKMDKKTYQNEVIVALINENFYAVKLDAEQKKIITYQNKQYKFVDQGRRGYNEFAAALLQGKMSYPSTVFMNKNEKIIDKVPGYLTPDIMEKILVYFGNEKYIDQTWEDFQKTFESKL